MPAKRTPSPPALRRAPLGVSLAATAKVASQAFDDALVAAGGSRVVWLVLASLRQGPAANQQRLAEQIGIRAATLTHHLARMESRGLVSRSKDSHDGRTRLVVLTDAGEQLFEELRGAALEFDRRLRTGLTEEDVAHCERVLAMVASNVGQGVAMPPLAPRGHREA